MCRRVRALLALLSLLAPALASTTGRACPRSCNCYQVNEVHCTFRSLLAVPPGLPKHMRRINLGFNSISRIHDGSLSGLKKVELLMLHSNDLHHLPDSVFRDMKSLQILKLSYNKLREISSSLTFSGLTSLLRLYLDHNLLQHIHPRALLQLPSLRLLRLQGNRLHQLHPHTLCTLSLLNTFYFSTLRHLDLSNNSLTTLSREMLATAPLLESVALQDNPWSCDCRMNWFLSWSLAHPGLMSCPHNPQCPICGSSISRQGQDLTEQTDLPCTSPVILSAERDTPLEMEPSEVRSSESFREPLGSASLELSDQQGDSVDLSCNITHSSQSQDIATPPDLSLSSSNPLPLALTLTLECPVEQQSYEKLWRILAYYSETAVRMEREIVLSKKPVLSYRYRQAGEADGYYHTGVKAAVKVRPQWLLQPAISIQLNRAQSNRHKVQLIYSTRVSAHPDPHFSTSLQTSQPWVLISTNRTTTALAVKAGSKVELPCPLISSGNPKVHWILPDGSIFPSNSLDRSLQTSASGLVLQKVQLSDAGIYYCVARAGRDFDVLPLRLAVEESSVPPSGEITGPSVTSTAEEPVTLSCEASGSPSPQISWLLPDGNVVGWGSAASGGITMQSNGSLSLLYPSEADVGYYRCIAVNQYGSDSRSMQLKLQSHRPPVLRNSFPRGPQSAAGRSTKIKAPLLHQITEGSGDEEEEESRTVNDNKGEPRPLKPSPNRNYPNKHPRRRGPMRGLPRRGGPLSSNGQRRNHLENRHRITTNKQRIDPQKWADLLAKIRQKTAQNTDNRPVATERPEVDLVTGGTTREYEGDDNTDSDRTEGTEAEGSSVDAPELQEESLQPVHPVFIDIQTLSEAETDTNIDTDTEIKKGPVRSTEKPTDTENGTEVETGTKRSPVIDKETVTSKSVSGTNEIIQEPGQVEDQESNPRLTRIRPQRPRQGLFPNLVPNSRPQSPWNARRRIGQRRRIMNRPGVRLLTPHQPPPGTTTPKSIMPSQSATDQTGSQVLASTTSSPAILLTQNDHIKNSVALISQDPSVFYTFGISTLTLSPASVNTASPTLADIMTHSTNVPDATDVTLFNTPTGAPTQLDTTIATTHISNTEVHTRVKETHMSSGKSHPPSSKHTEELEKISVDVPYVSHSSTSLPPIAPSTVPSTSEEIIITTSATTQSPDLPSTTFTTTTTITPTTTSPITSTTAATVFPTSSTIISTTFTPVTTTKPTTTSSSSIPARTASSTTTATISVYPTTVTTPTSTKTTAPPPPPPTTSTNIISPKTSPATTRAAPHSAPSTTTTTMTSTVAATRGRLSFDHSRGKTVSPNQSRFPTEWKKPGSNSIPDSHNSRPRWPPAPSLPDAPGAPVVRSRPRIADPHIRKVSFPAESTAWLACEFQGEPKPSITWTKVATGAVMSIHSRAQRFSVLPNGTLVIQNVQLQDRGTYVCSAHSFLGRDRLLTTLEVWTRPPQMQLASYRETSIHQGAEVHLECQADGVPAPLLSWALPDRSVLTSVASSNNRITMDTNGTLHILGILPSDRGVYRCVASNSAGAASASVRIHVSSLPPVMQLPTEEHLLLSPGMPVYAHCSARGAPPPTLRWRIPDGTIVRPSQFLHDNLFVLPNGTLHIRKIGTKDSGKYECTAVNAVGTDKRTVRVEINSWVEGERRQGGETNDGKKTVVIEETSSSSLHKTDSTPSRHSIPFSSPRLSVSSAFDGAGSSSHSSSHHNQLNFTKSPAKTNKAVTASPRHVTNINKVNPLPPLSTGPTINSKVSNNIRTTFSSFPPDKSRTSSSLHPLPVSSFTKAHIVSTSPSITTGQHGGYLNLHCSANGNPPPIIIWRSPSKKLMDINFSFDPRLKVHRNGTLSIQAVSEKDAGDYLCITRNKVGDDYRLLRVSVASKPAKIEPKQPLDQMVLFGRPLKMDCQASGLPDPAVRWRLPDKTMVNSVLQGEEREGRARRLIVFDNGTLLVPAAGMEEEGEYTCYAENQGGQDAMTIRVKVMMTSAPIFSDDRSYYVVKSRQGETVTIPCQATGDPAPAVTWFSPTQRVIPRSSGSRIYPERVAVVSDGTLQVRLAQKLDTGNYTCRASNSAGERSMVVSLEVEERTHGANQQAGGRSLSLNIGPGSTYSSRLRDIINSAGISQHGFNNGDREKPENSENSKNGLSDRNSKIRNIAPNTAISGFNPAIRNVGQNGFNVRVNGITTHIGSSVISNGPGLVGGRNSVGNNHTTFGKIVARNSVTKDNVSAQKASNDADTNGESRSFTSSVSNSGVAAETPGGNGPSKVAGIQVTNDNSRKSDSSSGSTTSITHTKNPTNTIVGVVTMKQQVVKGQTILLPCPSQGSPPPRLSWLLPGNGVLPAPYYGSRLIVHRNGSLELRSVRLSDSGTLVCVIRGEREQSRIQVELEVLEQWEEARSSHRGLGGGRSVPENTGLSETSHSEMTQKPLQIVPSSPAAPRPLGPPSRPTGPVSEAEVKSKTLPLLSIINGETLRLSCPVSQPHGHAQGSPSWTTPGGKVLTRGESDESGRYKVLEDGTLTVQQATVFDRGTYTCRSTSYDSSFVSAITIPVIVIAYPPRITMGPSPVTYTRPGVAVELPCLTIATPRATVTWETPDMTQLKVMDQARIYGNRYLSPQGSLVIQNPTSRDTGFYRCTASNVIGVDTKTTYLHVI